MGPIGVGAGGLACFTQEPWSNPRGANFRTSSQIVAVLHELTPTVPGDIN